MKDPNATKQEDNVGSNAPKKIEVTIPTAIDDTDLEGAGVTNFRNKVKLFQTTTKLTRAFGDGGIERLASRKTRMESNLGINLGNNLS